MIKPKKLIEITDGKTKKDKEARQYTNAVRSWGI
jgi:hypothetical protein